MRRAAARGCRLFDFGRSKLGTGAFAFKKNWGFAPDAAALPLPPRAGRDDPGASIRSTRNTACSSPPGSACRCRSPTCSARRSCAGSADAAICCSSPIASPIRPTRARKSAPGTCSWHLGAHAPHASRLLHRRSGRLAAPAARCARSAPILPRSGIDHAPAEAARAAARAARPAAVARLFRRSRGTGRLGGGETLARAASIALRLSARRHGALRDGRRRTCAACSTWSTSTATNGPNTRPGVALADARGVGARGAHAARLRASRRGGFRPHAVRLGTGVPPLRRAGAGGRRRARLASTTASTSNASRPAPRVASPYPTRRAASRCSPAPWTTGRTSTR